MTNSRRKGATYERDVERYLDAVFGKLVTRTNRSGYDGDDFDLAGIVSIEAKNHARLELAAWIDQADDQSGDRLPAVIHKRRGKANPADHYVTMTLRDWCALWFWHGSPLATLAEIERELDR